MAKKVAKKTGGKQEAATPSEMTVERVPIGSLKFDSKNARKHGERDLAVTGKSLDDFGQVEPLIVWRGTVIAGNGRLQQMQAKGWTEVDVRRVDHLTEAQARQLAIVLNRSAQLAGWDEAVLLETLRDLESLDVDLAGIGFDRATMDALVNDALAAASGDDSSAAPRAIEGGDDPSEARAGDLYFVSTSAGPPRDDETKYKIIVTCRDEAHQTELLDRFEQEQLECRALIS